MNMRTATLLCVATITLLLPNSNWGARSRNQIAYFEKRVITTHVKCDPNTRAIDWSSRKEITTAKYYKVELSRSAVVSSTELPDDSTAASYRTQVIKEQENIIAYLGDTVPEPEAAAIMVENSDFNELIGKRSGWYLYQTSPTVNFVPAVGTGSTTVYQVSNTDRSCE